MNSQEDIANLFQNIYKKQSHLLMKKEIHLKRNLTFLCLTDMLPAISKKLLDYFIHGDEEFIKFRQERFVKKKDYEVKQ